MATGPNYILDKGFLAEGGSVAYTEGMLVVMGTAEQSVAKATSASTLLPLGVCQEAVDAVKVATGKVFVGVRILGIARVKSGAAVAKGDRITNDTSARGVPVTRAITTAAPQPCFGIAFNAVDAADKYFDMLLTPGGTY